MQHPNAGQNIQQTSAFYVQSGDELVKKLYRKMHYLSSPQKKFHVALILVTIKRKNFIKERDLKSITHTKQWEI